MLCYVINYLLSVVVLCYICMYLLKLCKFTETFVICNIHFGLCSVSCSVIFRINIITKLTITKMAKAQWPSGPIKCPRR